MVAKMKCSVKDCTNEPYTMHMYENGKQYPLCKEHNDEYLCFIVQNKMLNDEIVKRVMTRTQKIAEDYVVNGEQKEKPVGALDRQAMNERLRYA